MHLVAVIVGYCRLCVSFFLFVCPLVCLLVFGLPVYPSIRLCIYRLEEFTIKQMKHTTQFLLVLRIRKCVAITQLPIYIHDVMLS